MRGCESQGGAKLRGRGQGAGFLGGAASPPPHQLGGLGERCKLPQKGPARGGAGSL